MQVMITTMAGSLGCMAALFMGRKVWKTNTYTKPRDRGIDPIGEAEVFLAYGRTKEAIRVLKDMLMDEPDNLTAKVTLLRAYSLSGDAKAYVQLAIDLKMALQGQPVWQTVQKMGRELAPTHPLFVC